MAVTSIFTSPDGKTVQIRSVEQEFWEHEGPIEFGQYRRDQDKYLNERIQSGDVVYHYTSIEGLHGIVRDRAMRASDLRIMNDRAETRYALAGLHDVLASDESIRLHPESLAALFRPGRLWQFGACFSRARDQLSQWRAYAGTRVGVAIGFDRDHLALAAQAQEGRIVDCRYLGKQDFLGIRGELGSIIAKLSAPGVLSAEGKIVNEDALVDIRAEIVPIATAIKHPSFKEEAEVRLVLGTKHTETVEFHSSPQALVPYLKVNLDCRQFGNGKRKRYANYLGIVEVIVWPNDADDQTLDAIDMLMRDVAHVLITRSNSPYRT